MSDRANWSALAPVSGLQNDSSHQPSDGEGLVWSASQKRYIPGKVSGTSGPVGPQGPQGPQGPIGATGPAGANGTNGTNGTNGVGVPAAGAKYSILHKSSSADYDTAWVGPYVINVKDYGAVGDGSTDDLTAINAAMAALTNYSTLYFPAGNYKITGQPNSITGVSNITICGDGWSSRIYSTVTGMSGNTFHISSTCSYVTIRDLALVGSATVRGSGIHIRLYAPYSEVRNVYVEQCSDFGIHLSNDAGGYSAGMSVVGCMIKGTLGDGIHAGDVTDCVIEDNVIISPGDDGIAVVADSAGHNPTRVDVVGNIVYNGTSRGIAILEAVDFVVEGNEISTTNLSGIEINRNVSTTFYSLRGMVRGNKVYNACNSLGPIGAINIYWANDVNVEDNEITNPATGAGIAFLDIQQVSITGNTISGAPNYGIRGFTFGSANVAATWTGIYIKDNIIKSTTAGDGIWVTPDVGKALADVIVDGNVAYLCGSGTFITYQTITTGRISNNTCLGSAYVNGGGNVGVTAVNNN